MSKYTPPKRRRHTFTLKKKLKIVQEANECNNIRATARKYKICPCQIRRWSRNDKMLDAIKKNPKAKTVHCGARVAHYETEQELVAWIKGLRFTGSSVSTRQIIEKALSIDASFHKGNWKALWAWVYNFLDRHDLSNRRVTRKALRPRRQLEKVQQGVVTEIIVGPN